MSRFPHVRPEPGFDLYAPIIPQARRGRRLAWVGGSLLFAIVVATIYATFIHLDRPALSEMHGTYSGWTAAFGPPRREAKLEMGDVR